VTPGARIATDGTFTLHESYTLHYLDADERYSIRVRGQFASNGVHGTLRVRTVARALGSDRVIDRCHTGSVGFAASI
jgi:hypothetical protein